MVIKHALIFILINLMFYSANIHSQNDNYLYDKDLTTSFVYDVPPSFSGGDIKLDKYIWRNMAVPNKEFKEINKMLIVSLLVEMNGSLSEIKIIQGGTPKLNQTVLNALKEMPAWNPAIKDGQVIPAYINLPIKLAKKPFLFITAPFYSTQVVNKFRSDEFKNSRYLNMDFNYNLGIKGGRRFGSTFFLQKKQNTFTELNFEGWEFTFDYKKWNIQYSSGSIDSSAISSKDTKYKSIKIGRDFKLLPLNIRVMGFNSNTNGFYINPGIMLGRYQNIFENGNDKNLIGAEIGLMIRIIYVGYKFGFYNLSNITNHTDDKIATWGYYAGIFIDLGVLYNMFKE